VPAFEVIVSGLVQGVGYRAFTLSAAKAHGVTGWVRNEPDGTVRILMQHSDSLVLEQLVREVVTGPPSAEVQGIEISILADHEALNGFHIMR
jgi:acylphosphatase